MHQNYQVPTIDPSLLDLNAHPKQTCYHSNTTLATDDAAITIVQADSEAVNDNDMSTWCDSYNGFGAFDGFETSAELESRSTLLHGTPLVEAWDLKGSGPDSSSQYANRAPTKESEPWNHLQTSAPGASLAPGLDHPSSLYQQNGSQWSPNLQDTSTIFTPSPESHDSCQASPMHQRMLRESHHTQNAPNGLSNSALNGLHHANHGALDIPRCDDFGQDYIIEAKFRGREDLYDSNLPLFLQDDERTARLTSSESAPIDVPRCRRPTSPAPFSAGQAVDYLLPSYNKSINPSRKSNFKQKLQSEDRDFLTSMELLRQQQQNLNTEGAEVIYDMTDVWCGTSDKSSWDGSQDSISSSPYNVVDGGAIYRSNKNSVTETFGAAMRISQSSQSYQPYRASSFPPTAGRFPTYMRAFRKPQKHRSTTSTSRTTNPAVNGISLPMRRRSSKNSATRTPKSGSLTAIPEDNPSNLELFPTVPIRGRRRGRLDPAIASAAGQKRLDGTVCIRCKIFKQTCEGGLPCESCQKNSNARSWGQPCHKARFLDLVEAGTCNRVFQQSASIMSVDGTHRVTLSYPDKFNLKDLTERLHSCESRFNIRVGQFSGSWYTISLTKLVGVMPELKKTNKLDSYALDDFGKPKFSKAVDWIKCITHCEPSANLLGRSLMWNNMPSRNSYSYVPLDGTSPRLMDVDNDEDKSNILFAVHLCRIIVRMLEVNAFKALQKTINDLPKNKLLEEDMKQLAQDLVELLFSLRWRISWWAVFGVSSSTDDNSDNSAVERVTVLARTLYFWYFVVTKKLSLKTSKGVYNFYADAAEEIYEEYPEEESINGFYDWLARGRSMVYKANKELYLPSYLPYY